LLVGAALPTLFGGWCHTDQQSLGRKLFVSDPKALLAASHPKKFPAERFPAS
jgi:hypothetical protein